MIAGNRETKLEVIRLVRSLNPNVTEAALTRMFHEVNVLGVKNGLQESELKPLDVGTKVSVVNNGRLTGALGVITQVTVNADGSRVFKVHTTKDRDFDLTEEKLVRRKEVA